MQSVRNTVLAVAFSSLLACGGPATGTDSAPDTPTFVYGPQDGLAVACDVLRSNEVLVAGTPLRLAESRQLTWDISIAKKGDVFEHTQRLRRFSLTLNGRAVIDDEGLGGHPVSVVVVVDRTGSVRDIENLEEVSRAVQKLAAPGAEGIVARVFSASNLRAMLAARFDHLVRDLVGRPTKVGSSWKVDNDPGATVKSKTVHVDAASRCGNAHCRSLKMTYEVDREAVTAAAQEYVRELVAHQDAEPGKVEVTESDYEMFGTQTVETATLTTREAEFGENARLVMAGGKRTFDVVMKGSTSYSCDVD